MEKVDGRYKPMKCWRAVSLVVPRELGEPISNFVMEQGATGIEEVDEDSKRIRLKTYFLQNGREKRDLRALHRYLKSLQMMEPEIPRIQIETTPIPEQDWGKSWKRFFRPVQVTAKFVVKPPWSSIRLKRNQIPIDITPGMAFGTGTHATTKLCIRALEETLKKRALTVLDVGTGSGILSIAAARLGAKEVLGLDTDGVAVEMARENVGRNRVSDVVKIRKGSIGNIRKRFDLVVANLDLKSLKRMRWPLLRHLRSKGFLILSGILEEEREKICRYYLETSVLKWTEVTQEGEWICLAFRKK